MRGDERGSRELDIKIDVFYCVATRKDGISRDIFIDVVSLEIWDYF